MTSHHMTCTECRAFDPNATRGRLCCCAVAHQLIEINAHSLFSKWFSESGKLVMKLFDQIQELVEDPDTLVCVMIDEVRQPLA